MYITVCFSSNTDWLIVLIFACLTFICCWLDYSLVVMLQITWYNLKAVDKLCWSMASISFGKNSNIFN